MGPAWKLISNAITSVIGDFLIKYLCNVRMQELSHCIRVGHANFILSDPYKVSYSLLGVSLPLTVQKGWEQTMLLM